MNMITEKEVATATKLAGRKTGVTRKELADKLSITESRAKIVLERTISKGTKLFTRPSGTGKSNRALVFSTSKPEAKAASKTSKKVAAKV